MHIPRDSRKSSGRLVRVAATNGTTWQIFAGWNRSTLQQALI
jgi:hypothetical protein